MKNKIPKTRYLLFASMILIITVVNSCKKNDGSVYPPVNRLPKPAEILQFYPFSGIPGDTITIVGKNLSTTNFISVAGIPVSSFKTIKDTLVAILGAFTGDTSIVKRGTLEIHTDSSGNLNLSDGSEFLFYPSRIEGFVASWQLLQKFNIWQYNTFDEYGIPYYNSWESPVLESGASFSKGIIGNSLELKNGYFETIIFDYSQ